MPALAATGKDENRETRLVEHYFDDLKLILSRIRTPARLDNHPWTKSLTVQDLVKGSPALADKSPGFQLTRALAELFIQMMPSTPPQDGKRLDTRWGRFGILAANYFAPLLFGRLYPRSLLEAWRRIDGAILLFVYGKSAEELTPKQVSTYRLVGDDLVFPANSTISDWHRRGLQDLADLFASREQCLSASLSQRSILMDGHSAAPHAKRFLRAVLWRWGKYLLLAAAALVLVLGAARGYRIYKRLQAVRGDIAELQALPLTSIQPGTLLQVAGPLQRTDRDLAALRVDVTPWLWATSQLGWVPVYGGDLQYSGDLLAMGSDFIQAARQTYETVTPIWDAMHRDGNVKAADLTSMLIDTRPALLQAQATLGQAHEARQHVIPERLSPTTRSWLKRADTYLDSMDEALSLALSVPRMLGASNEGPKTYLILIQNEDELRPTGGFITAVGKLVVWNGELINWDIADSYAVDDINKAYPAAPWQMQSFMNIPIMTFRDSSWFTDYPTAVQWAEYLYAYTNSYSVNGMIAIDQHVLKTLLSVTGPVRVNEIDGTVTPENVEEVMRAQKVPPSAELSDPNWYRKHFMNPIARAIMNKVLSGNGISWEKLLRALWGELDQRHILVELDDPVLAKVLAERNWDGAVARTEGDFLMVVDTNVGYNKTNAALSTNLSYDVDVMNASAPASTLAVFQRNGAQGPDAPCDQWPTGIDPSTLDYWYPIDRCYYGYMRLYLPAGTKLKSATPHAVKREEMILLDQDVPARVDTLDENLRGLQGFGTLLIVPIGKTLETDFRFSLPTRVIEANPLSNERSYRLRVQKQPGTEAIPITVRVHLPHGAKITSVSPQGSTQEGESLLFDLKLTTDVNIQIQFQP